MKTYHIIIDENINTKIIQVDLVPENKDESNILDNLIIQQLENHIILYFQEIYPNYELNKIIDSTNSPKRVVVELVYPKGI